MKQPKKLKKIVIFASGNGTNAINIYHYFNKVEGISVSHIFSNNAKAKVLKKANDLGITAIQFDKESFYSTTELLDYIEALQPNLIVLAGFLWKIPSNFIKAFPKKIINIHPALLPQYGGKGMYGEKVHKAVIKDGATKSGITIHYVNEVYDEGEIIAQYHLDVASDDNHKTLAEKIHSLEYKHFPKEIHKLLS